MSIGHSLWRVIKGVFWFWVISVVFCLVLAGIASMFGK